MDIDLTGLTVTELVLLRARVSAELDRRTILDETPREVAGLVTRYTAAGGNPTDLFDTVTATTTLEGA